MPPQSAPPHLYLSPDSLNDLPLQYRPGCTQGFIYKLIAEVVDELNLRGCSIAVTPVVCAVYLHHYFEFDVAESAHGRAPAMATGLKRVQPNKIIFTYQSDDDLAETGLAQTIWAATRGENITVFFINNSTLCSPPSNGHAANRAVPSIGIAELLAGLPGATYVVRRAAYDSLAVHQAKRAIATALQVQIAKAGFSLVEFISTRPTNGASTSCGPLDVPNPDPFYPLGDYKVADIVKSLN